MGCTSLPNPREKRILIFSRETFLLEAIKATDTELAPVAKAKFFIDNNRPDLVECYSIPSSHPILFKRSTSTQKEKSKGLAGYFDIFGNAVFASKG